MGYDEPEFDAPLLLPKRVLRRQKESGVYFTTITSHVHSILFFVFLHFFEITLN